MSSKGRSLPLTELANLFGRASSHQEKELRNFVKPPGPVKSYGPAKRCAPEACAATGSLLPPTPPLKGEPLRDYLKKITRGDAAASDFNWPVLAGLSDWVRSNGLRAVHREFDAVPLIGSGRKDLVCNVIVVDGLQGSMITLDPRRANFLTDRGVHVVQSLVHHLLREQYPDLAELDISVLQFPESDEFLDDKETLRRREVLVHKLGAREPIEWKQLSEGIAETLSLFEMVRRKAPPTPPKATGTDDLFGS